MRFLNRFIGPTFFAASLALLASGCSRDAKVTRTLQKANDYFASGKFDEAEIEYKNALQLDPLNPAAIGRLGLIYYEEGRVGLAFTYLKKGSELQPDDLTLRTKLGAIYTATGRTDDAQKEANYVLDRKPGDPEAPILLANSFSQKKDAESIRQRLLQLPSPAPESAPVLLALGTLELRLRNLKEAEAFFRRAEGADPKSPYVSSAMASIYLAQNDQVQAEAALRKASDLSPPRSTQRLLYVQYKLQAGDLTAARSLLEAMNKATPDYLPALITLAQLALSEKKYDECGSLLGKVMARDSGIPEGLMLNIQLAQARGNYDQAAAEAEKALKLYPKSPLLHQQLGFVYLAGGQTDKAAASFDQALALAPGLTDSVLSLAGINLRKGDFNPAIISLKQFVQDHPEVAPAWTLLAEAYRGKGSLAEALAAYAEMDKRFQASAQTPLLRGLVYLQQNRRAEARQEFNRALEIKPGFVPALEQLTGLDLADKQFPAAQQRLEAAIAKAPSQGGYHLLLARVLGAQNNIPGAEAALNREIELQPDNLNAYYVLAVLYYTNNEQAKALADLKALVAKNPKDTRALMMTGVLNEEIKDYAAARDAYEKLLAVNPRAAAALNNLAYLYAERFDQLDKGYEAAQKARDAAPQEPHIADTLGWILYRKGQYARAVGLLQESAGSLPNEPEILFHLGMANYSVGNEDAARSNLQRALGINETFKGADLAKQSLAVISAGSTGGAESRTALEKAVADRPNDSIALGRLAAAYQMEGNAAKAISTYEAATKASPGNLKAALSLIRLYTVRSDLTKAMELAKATRKLAPADAEVAAVLGRLAFQTGDYPWAFSLLQEAARKMTDDPAVLFDLGMASYSQGRTTDAETAMRASLQAKTTFADADKASRFLEFSALAGNPTQAAAASARVEQILKADPTDVPVLMVQGTINEQKADPNAARQVYERVLGVFPDFSPAQRRLAILYAADAATSQKALELGTKARTAFSDDAELSRALGIAAYRQKDYNRAATWLQESAAKRANDAMVQYYLGLSRFQLKQTAPSRQALQKAIDLGLTGDLAAEARRVLAELK